MSKFLVFAPVSVPSKAPGAHYSYEMEALKSVDAEIVECQKTEGEFIETAKEADALYVQGARITRRMIQALDKCRLIALGSVGVDYVDVVAATEKGIPVTNCPDTFIEEVADHAMMLLLAAHRRALEQDRMVREGRWADGRPQLGRIPRLMGQTLGFIAFGRVARAVAQRARPFGLRMMAYDPFVGELIMPEYDVLPATLLEVVQQSDFVSMHAPATPETQSMLNE